MTAYCRLLLLVLLCCTRHVGAQAPPAGALRPVQALALGPTATLGGAVRLPNHNTVVLLTDTEQLALRAVCLSAEGRTLWETTVPRYQHPKLNAREVFFPPLAEGRPDEKAAVSTLRYDTSLLPTSVFTEGNNLVLVERIAAGVARKMPKDSPLRAGQLYVQRLDEQGHLTQTPFEAPQPQPKVPAGEPDALVGRYADAAGYVEVMRTTAYPKRQKERVQTFALCHYDLGATAPRTEPLVLPATPWLTGAWDMYRLWYQDWAFLGHRPNQNYFCRRLLVNSAAERAGSQPLQFQVYIADDKGAVTPGGFATMLGLNKGTTPVYSGAIPNYGELDYAKEYFTAVAFSREFSNQTTVYDEWETTGVGSFYLDHATGDVLIFGEYGSGDLPTSATRPDLLGFFEQRYSSDGKHLAGIQVPYSQDLMAYKKAGSFVGQFGRPVHFHLDPLTGQSQYGFSPMHVMGSGEQFDLFLDQAIKLERIDYAPGTKLHNALYTHVTYAMPYWLYKSTGSVLDQRRYEKAGATDPAVYTALEKLNTAAGPLPFHEFYLSVTSPGAGLVVERREATGGTLQVYRF